MWLGPRTRPIESEIEGYAFEPIPSCRRPQTYPHLITSFAPPSPDTSCNSEGGAFFLAGHIRAAFTATSDTILNQVLLGASPLGYTA